MADAVAESYGAHELVIAHCIILHTIPHLLLLAQGHESNAHADISEDIFKQDAFEFNRIATSLFDCTDDVSTVGYTAQVSPKYAVEMHRDREQQGEGARAEGFGGVDPATGEFVVTYSNMQVHFHPVE